LMLLNWIFFLNNKKLKKYQQKWENEVKIKMQINGVFIIIYLIATIFFFGLALSKMY
jgi:hypothetical protein